ncbi:hypothetical protein [Micromonospora sp. NPDC005205]|uniref:hypothetical protein n=1 Tax=Micromonospora sp. NPDC005205 TaxID=3156714 RepID=UPI0033BC90BE
MAALAGIIVSVVAAAIVLIGDNSQQPPYPGPYPTSGEPSSKPSPGASVRPSEQFEYQIKLQHSRRALFQGNLFITADQEVEVTRSFMVRVALCGPQATTKAWCSTEVRPSGVGQQSESRSAKVLLGGRVQVHLASPDDRLQVRRNDRDQDNLPQPLTDPGDAALWVWVAQASTPDTYTMWLTIRVLDGKSDEPLVPDEIIPIQLTARRVPTSTQPSSEDASRGPAVDESALPGSQATSQAAVQPAQGDAGQSTFDRVVTVLAQVVVPIIVALIGAGLLANRIRRRGPPGGGSASAVQPPTASP